MLGRLLSLESVEPIEKDYQRLYGAYAVEYIKRTKIDFFVFYSHIFKEGDDVLMDLVG